jgi:hypothetical protein
LIAYKGHLEGTSVFGKFSSCHCFTQEQYIIGIYRVYTKVQAIKVPFRLGL